jgi:ABC-type polysaccharide/polyol phosphate transport system ATPase subunit
MATLKSWLLRDRKHRAPETHLVALEEVSFEVARGTALGIIGGNGSGKSTLLKLVAGILRPTSGCVEAVGRVAALIELGAGFHPEITGRENIFINGAILGLSRKEIQKRFDAIVEFSGLGDFLDEPVKNYSSGMWVRLGFAVAIHTDPDILLVDEVLAVGDEAFSHRCLSRIEALLSEGRTVLFVSHSLGLVESLSDRVLWLEKGRLHALGSPREVIDRYRQFVAEQEGRSHQTAKEKQEAAAVSSELAESTAAQGSPILRWGNRAAEVLSIRLCGGDGTERYQFRTGEAFTLQLEVLAHELLSDFVFGVAVTTPRGLEVFGFNTDLDGWTSLRWLGRGRVELTIPELRLAPGEYLVDVAIHARDGLPYDYRKQVLAFTVSDGERGVGVYFPAHEWRAEGPEWQIRK